jgi:hypothetical protein
MKITTAKTTDLHNLKTNAETVFSMSLLTFARKLKIICGNKRIESANNRHYTSLIHEEEGM